MDQGPFGMETRESYLNKEQFVDQIEAYRMLLIKKVRSNSINADGLGDFIRKRYWYTSEHGESGERCR